MNKKGFTLVELSIVLVIIGLLIGGILVAQSIIDSAKISNAVRQIQQYDIAVANFEQRYNQLPGDSDLFTPQGNNDRILTEEDNFWKHLSDSSIVNESYSNDMTDGYVPGFNVPAFLDSFLLSRYLPGDGGFYGAAGWQYGNNVLSLPPITSVEYFALENKLDDGSDSTGVMRAFTGFGSNCTIAVEECNFSITMKSTIGAPLDK